MNHYGPGEMFLDLLIALAVVGLGLMAHQVGRAFREPKSKGPEEALQYLIDSERWDKR